MTISRLLAVLTASVVTVAACGGEAAETGPTDGGAPAATAAPDTPEAVTEPPADDMTTPTEPATTGPAETQAAAAEPASLTVFVGPSIHSAAIFLAEDQGFYDDEGLDVDLRSFPSGTTALESFRSGLGDIVLSGNLPAVRHFFTVDKDFRVITPMTRDQAGLVAVARAEIQEPSDLVGGTVATRVGSVGSWFLSDWLASNGVDEADVEVVNLDTNQMVPALDRGDIDAFFIWEPFPTQAEQVSGDAVHRLGDATGLTASDMVVMGARPDYIDANADVIVRWLRATMAGAEFVDNNHEAVMTFLNEEFGQERDLAEQQLGFVEFGMRFDEEFYESFNSLSDWALEREEIPEPLDMSEFLWTDGLAEIDPALVDAP